MQFRTAQLTIICDWSASTILFACLTVIIIWWTNAFDKVILYLYINNWWWLNSTHRLGSVKWRVFICSAGSPNPRVAKAWCRTSWVTWGTAPPRVYVRHMGVSKASPFVSISLPHRTPTLFTDSSTNSITPFTRVTQPPSVFVIWTAWWLYLWCKRSIRVPQAWLTGSVMARFPTHLTEEEKKLKKRYQKLREKVSVS